MRGWITGRNATCAPELSADDSLELVEGALEIVVDDLVMELRLERELALRDVEALVDLALRDEPVVAPVLLVGPARPGGCRHGEFQLRDALREAVGERALSLSRRPGDDEDREPALRLSG